MREASGFLHVLVDSPAAALALAQHVERRALQIGRACARGTQAPVSSVWHDLALRLGGSGRDSVEELARRLGDGIAIVMLHEVRAGDRRFIEALQRHVSRGLVVLLGPEAPPGLSAERIVALPSELAATECALLLARGG